jgi:type IV pilus assembly protein PilE
MILYKKATLPCKDRLNGFTLIELMITVAIVAILAAIALPNYTQYVERGRRAEAVSILSGARQFAERFYTERRTYVGLAAAMPTTLTRSPESGTNIYYNISAVTETATTFLLSATPNAALWTPTKCGTLSIDQLSTRTVSSNTVQECF